MSFNIYKAYQLNAAESILDPDELAHYRRICRWYSKTFHTALHIVFTLPFDTVLTNYYEQTMEDMPFNALFDQVIEDFLPELQEERTKEDQDYAKALEDEQAMTLARAEAKRLKAHINPIKPQSLKQDVKDQSPQPGDVLMSFDNIEEP